MSGSGLGDGVVARMEALAWAVAAIGVATTAGRASWTVRAWPGLAVALGWAAWPHLIGDAVSRTSRAQAAAWFAAPDHRGAVAAVLMAEAIAGAWTALVQVGGGEGRPLGRVARRVGPWLPSPTLALGLLGVQVALYHRLSGWGFATIDAAVAAALGVGLGGGALLFRWAVRPARRRGEGLVYLYAAMALLGAALPPLVVRPPTPAGGVAVDFRALGVVALGSAAVIGLGACRRAGRVREGAVSR